MRGNSFCAEVDKISLHIAYYFSALKNSVVYEPPLQEKKMQRRLTTRQALEMILSEVNPCDSDGEDIELQPDSDSELSDLRKTTILGTVNKIRREIPQSARHTDRNEFTTQVFSTTAATLTVYILSSMHSVIQTDNTTKRKPNTVTLYNTTKCGVDVMDQMVQEYTVRTGTRRWPVAVFYNMIDMAALNAHVLYQACIGRQERRVDFLVELARELANSHMCAKEARKEQLLRTQPSTPSPGKRAMCQVKHQCKNNHATV
ncbi:hypothetical protein DPX16_22264 [Anabarilius grahami]|uniref:PiggyBac transposable element-derived protein domain-containing protein n=1 Tax=Anabarilius grahami TaxID=495550 RepID=A0A3N0Y035_ANAGA|nr:hypothetical protein DPX16_22264 [Anabarilius grahami]